MSQFSSIDNRVRLAGRPGALGADADTAEETAFSPLSAEARQPANADAPFALSGLDGSSGFRIDGGTQFGMFGSAVAGAGDVNGDGKADLIVGEPGVIDFDGAAYVIYGGALGSASTFSSTGLDGSNGFKATGQADETLGRSVAGAGDVNGDGLADLVMGAGSAYVLFGSRTAFGPTVDLTSLDGSDGFRIEGEDADNAFSAAAAGDVNGDGVGDLLIGAPAAHGGGAAYVVFGRTTGFDAVLSLADLDGSDGFKLVSAEGGSVGGSVASAGDVNGDGLDDLIIGARYADPGGDGSLPGTSYVVFGKGGGFDPSIDLSTLNGSDGFAVVGDRAHDKSGSVVSSAGDVDGDGLDDLIVVSINPGADGDDGPSYLVYGRATSFDATLDLGQLTAEEGVRIDEGADHVSGWSTAAAAGDFNGDGFDDLIIGIPFGYGEVHESGAAYLVYGQSGGFDGPIDLTDPSQFNGLKILGADGQDQTGSSVSAAGDVNGDGLDDLIIGAPGTQAGGYAAGSAYVIYGQLPDEAVTRIGSQASQRIFGGDFDDVLSGLGGNDQLFGNGGADTLLGGTGDDTVRAGAGDDSVDGGQGQDTVVLTGELDDYVINALGGGLGRFIDQRGGAPDGVDLVTGMESFVFADVTLTAAQLFRTLPVTGGVANHGLVEAGAAGAGVASAAASALGASGAIGAVVFDLAGWTQTGASTYSHAGVYGAAVLNVSTGVVSYAVDNQDADTQALAQGQGVTEDFSVALYDQRGGRGSTTVTFAITGGNDAPIITGGGQVSTTLVEAGLGGPGVSTASATAILFSDPDAGDSASFSTDGWQRVGATSSYTRAGVYGTATLDVATGVVSYVLDNADADTQALSMGTVATDSFQVSVADGHGGSTAKTVAFAIQGGNDAPAITGGGQVSTALVEAGLDGPGASTASATAILFHDPDGADAPAFSTSGWVRVGTTDAYTRAGVYGTATLDVATGVVSYELNNADRDTQALGVGDTATDSFLVTISDGHGGLASTTVSFTIHGAYDSPVGTRGDDVLAGDVHNDLIDGGKGDDAIDGGGGDDTLLGGAGKDSLMGGFGADVLSGAAGADSLNGAAGPDRLTGGLGADVLTGGTGKDIFIFESVKDSSKKAADLIADLGKTDVIDVSAIDADSKTDGDQAFHLVSAFSHAAGELVISYDAGKDRTLVLGDVNGDGKADLVIAIAGDAHSFHHFVL